MLVNPVTLQYQKLSNTTSQYLQRNNLNSLKLPHNEYKNFILIRKGNLFQKKFRKTKSTIHNLQLRIIKENKKENNQYFFPSIKKSSVQMKKSLALPSLDKTNLLAEKLNFLEMKKIEFIKTNEEINFEKLKIVRKKNNIQKEMLNTKKFLRDNFLRIQVLTKSLNENNFSSQIKKEILSDTVNKESKKIQNIKSKIQQLEQLLSNLTNKVNIKNEKKRNSKIIKKF